MTITKHFYYHLNSYDEIEGESTINLTNIQMFKSDSGQNLKNVYISISHFTVTPLKPNLLPMTFNLTSMTLIDAYTSSPCNILSTCITSLQSKSLNKRKLTNINLNSSHTFYVLLASGDLPAPDIGNNYTQKTPLNTDDYSWNANIIFHAEFDA